MKAAKRGANQRAHQAGNGNKAHGLQAFAQKSPQHRQPPDRQQQGTAQSLQHPCGNQLAQVLRQGTGNGAQNKQGNGSHIHTPGAKTVSQPEAGISMAMVSEYATTTDCMRSGLSSKLRVMAGTVVLTVVASSVLHEKSDGHQPEHHAQ